MARIARPRHRDDQDARQRCRVQARAAPRTGKRGRPALKGARLGALAQLAASAVFEPITISGPGAKTRVEHVWRTTCLWYGPFHTRPVVIMLIRKPDRIEGYDVAIASTDTDATTAELIARYDSRWTIETAHQEAKAHGVGQARNRVRKAVERTVPFGFLAQTITIAWYALHGDPDADLDSRRHAAPWYRHKATISYADMLTALRRELIRHEYWAQAPAATSTPQITTAPSPSALSAA